MKTIVSKDIISASELLKSGALVAIPTETVYGLAGNGLNEESILKIFEAKNRPFFDPLILHIADTAQLNDLVESVPDIAKKLIREFWPGPLTLVLKKKPVVPDLITSGMETVAIRMPSHPTAIELLKTLSFPLAAPSANPFGYISPTTAEHVLAQLSGKIPMILDGGPCAVGVESTIIDCSADQPIILRKGGIAAEQIEKIIGPVAVQDSGSSRPAAPGMLESHYAPRKPMLLGDIDKLLDQQKSKKIAVLSFQKRYDEHINRVLSEEGNISIAARNLFDYLRKLDSSDCDLIIAEEVPERGLGKAINDRLRRASAK